MQKSSGGYLGIGGLDISSERAKALNLKEERGVEVSSLAEDGPAAKAGLKEGDVVLEFNGQPVQGTTQFQRLVRETPVGRQVKIAVWRAGATQTLTATVGENRQATTVIAPGDGPWNFSMPEVPSMPNIEIPRFQMSMQNPMLGIVGESLAPEDQLAEFFGVQEGVLVRSVKKGSAAEKAGHQGRRRDHQSRRFQSHQQQRNHPRPARLEVQEDLRRHRNSQPERDAVDRDDGIHRQHVSRAALVEVNC